VCFFAHLESEVRKRDDSAQLSPQPDMAAGTVTFASFVFVASMCPKQLLFRQSRWQRFMQLMRRPRVPADAQLQQQEVAQAFQVLMNANAQNPGSLAGLNLMNSLVQLVVVSASIPVSLTAIAACPAHPCQLICD
jgi:hypothetical protein